jgi:hypothetical protein
VSTPVNRRPRPASEAPHQARLAPAFDRDALALSYLHEKGHLSRSEFRDNLRALGVRLGEDDEPRRLVVPRVVAIEPPAQVVEPEPAEPAAVHVEPEDDDEPWEPWDDEDEKET